MHPRSRAPVGPALAFALAFVFAAPARTAIAQTGALSGVVTDRGTHKPLGGARVTVIALADSADAHSAVTGDDGRFRATGLAFRDYRLAVTRLGFAPAGRTARVRQPEQDLGE